MNRFKKPVSYVLLLLFIRIMLPEKTVLQLHRHAHTEDRHVRNDYGFKLDTKHTHCHIDELYNAGFVPEIFPAIQAPALIFADTYSANLSYRCKYIFPDNTYLRGPPISQVR
ncbi:hypothetical protein [Adhaeribacter rhizoryzae]|uniref:Uncharacterized protein n=1 Tax=Adhaeribacter rhizoryzae TaxID=2607907 RepID=A0A5M6D2F5_9BACT|nr:hypothetical protein [Adhaeribacter rhizoryzae]KAA5541658.1 hypothetical protein F0145_20010 [Adhaeribacter rhizoryzae]